MRAISNLMGLLIVIAIVVGAFAGITAIISSVMQKSIPKAVDLTVEAGTAVLSDNVLMIKLMVTPVGREPILITGIEIFEGSSTINYVSSKIYSPAYLKPGHSYEVIIVLYGATGVSSNDMLTVIIEWEGQSGFSSVSKYHVRVMSR